jgi:hypothetical protein
VSLGRRFSLHNGGDTDRRSQTLYFFHIALHFYDIALHFHYITLDFHNIVLDFHNIALDFHNITLDFPHVVRHLLHSEVSFFGTYAEERLV